MKFYNLMRSLPLVVALLGGSMPSLATVIPAASITRFQRYTNCSLSPSSYEISRPSISATDADGAYRACERECRRHQPDCDGSARGQAASARCGRKIPTKLASHLMELPGDFLGDITRRLDPVDGSHAPTRAPDFLPGRTCDGLFESFASDIGPHPLHVFLGAWIPGKGLKRAKDFAFTLRGTRSELVKTGWKSIFPAEAGPNSRWELGPEHRNFSRGLGR